MRCIGKKTTLTEGGYFWGLSRIVRVLWLADWRVYVYFAHVLFKYICVSGRTVQTRRYNLTTQVLQTSQVSRASLYLIHPGRCFTGRQEHSNDVRVCLWRRLIYRDADRTALCFQNVLGSYSNLPWAQSLPLRERDKGRTTKSKQRTERTWSG